MKMKLKNLRWLLLIVLFTSFLLTAYARRGGGGSRGGSRGSSSRGSSSRGSSSSGRTTYDRSRDRSRSDSSRNPSPPAPPPKKPDPPPKPRVTSRPYVPSPRPSAPEVRQPANNPNYREQSPNQPASNPNFRGQDTPGNQQPPPYSPRQNPPGYSPPGQPPAGAPPLYSPAGQQPPHSPGGAPPPYSPQGPSYNPSMGVQNANYPRQPGMPGAPQQPGVPNANYPRQQGSANIPNAPQQPGVSNANYPRQQGSANIPNAPQQPGFPRQPGYPGGNYPAQGAIPGANYPRQPGGIPGANYPRQPGSYPAQTLGGHVWQPQSGKPAPSYMNYGGLPTGSNMYSAPYKKKGLLGSVMGMGSSHKMGKPNKYYGSYPSPYGHGMGGMGKMGGFGGMSGRSVAMYTILPYMAYRASSSMFRPRFGFMPLFLPSPFYHHHHYGYYGHGHYGNPQYDVYNKQYAGRCYHPISPKNANITCNSTYKEVDCEVNCNEGYFFPDNSTRKENKCWHVTGVWRPERNFPECKPICNETCLNGGSCASPGVCGCPPEYRGRLCEHHFLKCDVRKLAGDNKIRWVCTHTKYDTKCRVKCREPKEFATPPAEEYKCTPDGTWSPAEIPLCTEPKSTSQNETVTTTTVSTNEIASNQ